MRNTFILTAIAGSLTLAGCGQHGSIGAESTSKPVVSASTQTKIEQLSKVKRNMTAKVTIPMPAADLIIEALQDYVAGQPRGAKPDPHIAAARDILSVSRPVLGWTVNCFGCSAQDSWARQQATSVAYSNLLLTGLADRLASRVLADPSAAHKAIIAAFLAIPPDALDAARQQAEKQMHSGSFTADFSGGEGVHFMLGASDFKGSGAGWLWKKNGVTWYGDGVLSGQKFEAALYSSIDTGTSAEQSDLRKANFK